MQLLCAAVFHTCRRTLAAVHSGADLSAAIDGVLGYDAGECKGERFVLVLLVLQRYVVALLAPCLMLCQHCLALLLFPG
jgi:hypothetical protein